VITRRARIGAVLVVGALALSALVGWVYRQTDTIPPQAPAVGLVERQLKRELRRGWMRVLLDERVLEVRVNGEALLGYTGRVADLSRIDTAVVRGLAKHALDLLTPPQYGGPPSVDSVRIRLRHAFVIGPFPYRRANKDYTFPVATLRPGSSP
jgi:hypothetical protein